MKDVREEAAHAFHHGATEGDNPYDKLTQPEEMPYGMTPFGKSGANTRGGTGTGSAMPSVEQKKKTPMKTYTGTRQGSAADVMVNGQPLDPRLDLWNHSPSGFEWGYGGSGPAQLALALLADHLDNDDDAVRLHQDFKRAVVANLPYSGWKLTGKQIREAVETLRRSETAQLRAAPQSVTIERRI
jgi:hypothetical protein